MSDPPENLSRLLLRRRASHRHLRPDQADSDQEAIATAEALGFGTKCEIWDGDRLVAQLEAARRTG